VTPGELGTTLGVVVSLLVAVFAFVRGMRAEKTNEKKVTTEERQAEFGANLELNKYIDARVDRLVGQQVAPLTARIEKAEAKAGAASRIIRAIALVWRPEYDTPDIDPADVEIVGERVPTHWIRRSGEPKRI
jgi:hypothetical protein